MGVQFMDCRGDQGELVRQFFAEMYSPGYVLARNADFFHWQFGAVPSRRSDGLDLKLALVDGAVAGCIGYIPVELNVGGNTVHGAWAANWMVDDRYRRLGLGPLLIRELSRSYDVTLALGGNQDAHTLLTRMGWTDFGHLPRVVAVLDPAAAALLTDRAATEDLPAATVVAGEAERVETFADDAGTLWEKVSGSVAGTRRTAEYLNWRYSQHPVFNYRSFEHRVGGELKGVAVYRLEAVRDLPATVGRLVELIAEPGDALPLVRTVIADAAAEGAAILDFFCPLARLQAALEPAGFTRETARFPMLFQPLDRSRAGVLFMADLRKCGATGAADWYVTTADGDQDRPN